MQLKTFFLIFALFSLSALAEKKPLALVYAGDGSCDTGCSEAAAEVAKRAGFKVRFVNAKELNPKLLERAALWVQPGGNAIDLVKKLRPDQVLAIRSFIAGGGLYLGFCAGSFFADEFVDNEKTMRGLGVTPGEQFDLMGSDTNAYILPTQWKGRARALYFQEGGYLTLDPTRSTQVSILARYHDDRIAAVTFPFGLGKVAITGVHPEAPESWKKADKLEDPDGDDFDLADEMIQAILN